MDFPETKSTLQNCFDCQMDGEEGVGEKLGNNRFMKWPKNV